MLARFRVEELFLDSKSGAFGLEDSRPSSAAALERLYLVAAVALLYATTMGMAVQVAGLRRQVDPHWRRGISYSLDWAAVADWGAAQRASLAKTIAVTSTRPTALFCLLSSRGGVV